MHRLSRTEEAHWPPIPVKPKHSLKLRYSFIKHFLKKQNRRCRVSLYVKEFFLILLDSFIEPVLGTDSPNRQLVETFKQRLFHALRRQPPVTKKIDESSMNDVICRPWAYLRMILWITVHFSKEAIPTHKEYLLGAIGLKEKAKTWRLLAKSLNLGKWVGFEHARTMNDSRFSELNEIKVFDFY